MNDIEVTANSPVGDIVVQAKRSSGAVPGTPAVLSTPRYVKQLNREIVKGSTHLLMTILIVGIAPNRRPRRRRW